MYIPKGFLLGAALGVLVTLLFMPSFATSASPEAGPPEASSSKDAVCIQLGPYLTQRQLNESVVEVESWIDRQTRAGRTKTVSVLQGNMLCAHR